MIWVANDVFFNGDAPLGFMDNERGGATLYCAREFGIKDGRFTTTFRVFDVTVNGDDGEPHVAFVRSGSADYFDELTQCVLDESVIRAMRDTCRELWAIPRVLGTERQLAVLKEAGITDYPTACLYLRYAGLYEDDLNGRPYRYGSDWLDPKLPKSAYRRVGKIVTALDAAPTIEQAVARYLETNPDTVYGER